jgi:hypothetical protein
MFGKSETAACSRTPAVCRGGGGGSSAAAADPDRPVGSARSPAAQVSPDVHGGNEAKEAAHYPDHDQRVADRAREGANG